VYSIERLLRGRALIDVLPSLRGAARRAALDSYLDVASQMQHLAEAPAQFGEMLAENPLQCKTWPAFLRAMNERQFSYMREHLLPDVPHIDAAVARLDAAIDALPAVEAPRLVHGDYFPGNVLADDAGRITAVIDFGPLTVAGDPMMDLASAAVFLEVLRNFEPDDAAYVTGCLIAGHGEGILEVIATYRAWYALRLSHSKFDDPRLYAWCAEVPRSFAP
jgi:aminoglycoside phosphotransferase (APT) family kinase protein